VRTTDGALATPWPGPAISRRKEGAVPFYPVIFAASWVISLFNESSAAVQVLSRPLVMAVLLVLFAQVLVTLLIGNRHLAAIIVFLIELALIGLSWAGILVITILVIVLGIGARKRRPLGKVQWWILTRGLNPVFFVLLFVVLSTALVTGALTPPERLGAPTEGVTKSALPDIYLVLLDGYPRSDTLAHDFGYDNTSFLRSMEGLGFDVAGRSHSNYNGTELTLASMFNAIQVADLPQLAPRPSTPQGQERALSRAINQGHALDTLRDEGYEIVTAPSEISSVTLYGADRMIDGGEISSFELEILQQGAFRQILPDVQRSWLSDQHRTRISGTFDRLGELAAERTDHPRFVFAHVLAPHAPIVFGPNGEPRDGWPCFPRDCPMFYGGQQYREAALPSIRDEIEYLNVRVKTAVEQILARSDRPPVIIFFSDHGSRHDFDDNNEMLRSFFIALTPDRPGLFPVDVSPINVIPRLLNAYAGTHEPLATEESYVVNMNHAEKTGMLNTSPWPVPDD
jgi:hypothetical protein